MKILGPGALWVRSGKVGVGKQSVQQRLQYLPGAGPAALGVIQLAFMLRNPTIQQGVAGSGIPAAHRTFSRYQRDIGNPTNVDHGAGHARLDQTCAVKRRYERGAFPSGGHVPPPKVRHHCHTRQLCQPVRISDLHRIRCLATRVVSQRLAVAANGCDVRGADTGFIQEGLNGGRVFVCQLSIEHGEAFQLVIARLSEGQYFVSQGVRHAAMIATSQRALTVTCRDQHRVDAIRTGARHHTDKVGVAHSTKASCCALRRLASCCVGCRIAAR